MVSCSINPKSVFAALLLALLPPPAHFRLLLALSLRSQSAATFPRMIMGGIDACASKKYKQYRHRKVVLSFLHEHPTLLCTLTTSTFHSGRRHQWRDHHRIGGC